LYGLEGGIVTQFVLASDHTRALDHFAGYGLSAILEEAGERDIRLHWSDSPAPKLTLTGIHSTPTAIAAVVHRHAIAHCAPESWVQQITTVKGATKSSEVGLFSPRIATPDGPDAWKGLYAKRLEALDAPTNRGWLDSLMLHALGEPAHWLMRAQTPEPDRGASRWEMKTRNRGEDFTRNRLALLAKTVAARTCEAVLDGLTGDSVDDEAGKNNAGSRSGTGLTSPGPVDNALAWSALWGLSAFRITHRVGRQSFTPGAYPQTRIHPEMMVLPLVTSPTSPAKLRRIIRSRAFDDAAFGKAESAEVAVGRESLRASKVAGLVRFNVRVAGSASAPERQVLAGVFERL
jgi:CRISPR-associated protein Csb3